MSNFLQIIKNKDSKYLVANTELQAFARSKGIKLVIGDNLSSVEGEGGYQGIAINEDLCKVFELLEVDMSPSYNQLLKHFEIQEPQEIKITFTTKDGFNVTGNAYLGIMSKTLDIWFDFNDINVTK